MSYVMMLYKYNVCMFQTVSGHTRSLIFSVHIGSVFNESISEVKKDIISVFLLNLCQRQIQGHCQNTWLHKPEYLLVLTFSN